MSRLGASIIGLVVGLIGGFVALYIYDQQNPYVPVPLLHVIFCIGFPALGAAIGAGLGAILFEVFDRL